MYAHNNERAAVFNKMLENCKNFDKDVRHTGALDLCNEINKSAEQLEENLEKRICAAFIQHLTDESIEVKSNAVKCIQRISPKIREVHLTMIMTKLINEIVNGLPEALDIFSLTVRGVVSDCSDAYATSLIATLYPQLKEGIERGSTEVKEECLEICTELFKRFGLIILRQPNLVDKVVLMNAINTQLTNGATLSLRKRASYAMGQFAVILNFQQLQKLCQLLLTKIRSNQAKEDTIIQVQCLSIIAKSIGSKLAPFLKDIIPTLERLSSGLKQDESVDEDNELAESSLSTLEAIVRKCPLEVNDNLEDLLQNSFKLCSYDPNYVYNDDDDEDEKMDDDEDDGGWGDDYSDDGGMAEDDDDTSWKVRRSAIAIIDTVLKTRPDKVKHIINLYSNNLIDRVKERVDDVKIQILNTLQAMIHASMETQDVTIEMDLKAQSSVVRQFSMGEGLKDKQLTITKILLKQIKSKNLKVKVAAIATLSELALLVGSELDTQFNDFWPELCKTIDDRSSFEPTISSLIVLRRLFRSKKLEDTRKQNYAMHAQEISEFLKKCIEHEYSKVVFEGLRVSSSFLNALRNSQSGTVDPQYSSTVNQLHSIILEKLGRVNIDTDVKHCCLLTASSLISTSHPILGPQNLDKYFNIFIDRMMSELTREAALKGLTMIAANSQFSGANAPVIPINAPESFLPAFFDLLKKQQRQIHLNTLDCLEALTRRYQSQMATNTSQIQSEISNMIDDQDLQKANLALKIATNLIQACSDKQAHQPVIGKAIDASGSEMIQGNVKETIKNFFKVASSSGVLENAHCQMLLNFVNLKSQGAAACLAISISCSNQFSGVLNQLWSMTETANDPNQLIVGALTIGEYGKIKDLSTEQRILPMVQRLFVHAQEDVKFAASICMGNVAIGNPEFFLPKVFELVNNSQEAQKNLFLNTIREIIIVDSHCLQDYIFQLNELLISHTTSASQQIRNIVAEILGRLLADFPEDMFDSVDASLKAQNNLQVATTARSIKYAGSRLKNALTLQMLVEQLVLLKNSSDVEVKKNALEALTSVIHSNWGMLKAQMRDFIAEILKFALEETVIRPELIKEVDLGPFKHKVDDGLPIRKAAFQLLETLQDRASDCIDLSKLVDTIVRVGLADTAEECVVLNLNILAKMSQSSIMVVLACLDQIVNAFQSLFTSNLKLISSQQSQERAQNIVRALLRVVYLINSSPDLQDNASNAFGDFVKNQVQSNADSRQIYEKIAASFKTSAQSTFFN